MEYEFSLGDKQLSVSTEKGNPGNPGSLKASVDGVALNIEATKISANCFLLLRDGRSRRVYAASNDTIIFVFIDGKVIRLERTVDEEQKFSREGLEYGAKDKITTPMPGKVVKILVSEGEKVTVKQSLVIVESMKMENEIKSPANGTVKSIHFKAGDLVESGKPIITLDPE